MTNAHSADNSDARNQWGTTRWQERIEREDAERQRYLAEQMRREIRGESYEIACVGCGDPIAVRRVQGQSPENIENRSCPKCKATRTAPGTRDAALADAKAKRAADAENRKGAILRLRRAGLAVHLIAAKVGTDHSRVRRVLKEAGVE